VVDGKLVAINNGINAPTIVANPAIFKQAGVELPDDATWTWDDYAEIAAAITANTPDGIYESASFTSSDYTFTTFLRQRGKELFTEDGLGFDVRDAQAWFDLEVKMRSMGAIPTAPGVTEDEALSMDQSWMATGRVAMTSNVWTNQVGVIDEFSGEDAVVLRLPSTTGSAADTLELLPVLKEQPRLMTVLEKHVSGVITRTGLLGFIANSGYPAHVKLWLEYASPAALQRLAESLEDGRYDGVARSFERRPE